ncbi:MAG: UDP-N-acetylmuramoyl-L-alanyl-D-glutamate--2,6-diaminopimelate ligase [Alphaproteobacteria bacterium]|tara:strand:- start:945 stop:2429 length:1485 start_codon:yes stop_codon:yes gene_type:complete
MKLNKILKACDFKMEVSENLDFNIKGLSIHSKSVKDNYIFGAIKGNKQNGEDFVADLQHIKNLVVVISKNSFVDRNFKKSGNIIFIKVNDVRFFISKICSIIFPNNIEKKFAVTGTNGKSSVAEYVLQIWEYLRINSALIGTLGVKYKKKISINPDLNLTTPDVVNFHKVLNKLDKSGCRNVIFEASSIGLDQKRLSPEKFNVVAFTNLSNDHLDYHKSIRNYKFSKSLLFLNHTHKNSLAVINTDTKYSKYFINICNSHNLRVLDYGKKANFLKIKSIKRIKEKLILQVIFKGEIISTNLNCISEFEIYNRLCSLVMVFNKDLKSKNFRILNDLHNPKGRIEKIYDKEQKRVYIDYAHTPDALSQVLSSLRKITKRKLILVFGCGGDRDQEKRKIMTNVALKFSDLIFITDDNPRFESPEKIRNDMIIGLKELELEKIRIIGNRSKAISSAIKLLSKQDILLIAGKGHENYQIINGERKKFSDESTAKRFLKK